ncbi:hypothetical protein F383_33386 [Gossypium arboreum]|uniref:Uncharacterized protein n=1 Tax=Gossypium arboreum TaxID=29729 RepID=A0A0B0N2P8_GOSAR|nr:hypothetical protein F383_33386 [Gossypium arboreum]
MVLHEISHRCQQPSYGLTRDFISMLMPYPRYCLTRDLILMPMPYHRYGLIRDLNTHML